MAIVDDDEQGECCLDFGYLPEQAGEKNLILIFKFLSKEFCKALAPLCWGGEASSKQISFGESPF